MFLLLFAGGEGAAQSLHAIKIGPPMRNCQGAIPYKSNISNVPRVRINLSFPYHIKCKNPERRDR